MNLFRSLHIGVFALALLISAGCHSSGHHTSDNEPDILESPLLAPLSDSIQKFPNDADLYFRRATLLTRNNAHEAAAGDYKKAWSLKPTEATALQYASNLSITAKPLDKLKLLQDAVEHFPDNLELKRLLGEAYVDAGKAGEALDWYSQVLKNDSMDFEAWYEKGLILLQLKDTAQAIEALKKAHTIQPVNTYALELAQVYAEKGNPAALRICNEVMSNDSAKELTDPFFIKGIYYANTKLYEQALLQFDSCIRRDWKFTDAYIEKGIVFFKQKNYDEALNTFRMAATVSNTYPDAYYWMGRC
jgi:tetratricopeptide (TPR) repeat protein